MSISTPANSHPGADFSFGRNWESFVKNYYTDERVEISKRHILDFLGMDSLTGVYFLDAGCGSGLSSLAAFRAGASRIVSFDVDPYSVKTTQRLRELVGKPDYWHVAQGSILDQAFLSQLDPADVLYSWGVLHHTGAMWQAIERVMPLMKADGLFYVALYTTTPASAFWIRIKQEYNRASYVNKRRMEIWYIILYIIVPQIRARQKPLAYILDYKRSRGMEFLTDVRDWLGGWPYEDASVDEVLAFYSAHDFQSVRVRTGEANTEYLFAHNSKLVAERPSQHR